MSERLDVDAVIEGLGFYEDVEEQECLEGTPLGFAFEQGWNAALVEARARLKRALAGVDGAERGVMCVECGLEHEPADCPCRKAEVTPDGE